MHLQAINFPPRKHALCIKLEPISSAHNHVNSAVLQVRCLANGVGLPPPSVTHMALLSAVKREFALVCRIFNPSLCSSRFTDQLMPPSLLPSPPFPSSPFLSNEHKHAHAQRKPD